MEQRYATVDLFTGEIMDTQNEPPHPNRRRTNPIFEALAELWGITPAANPATGRPDWLKLTDNEIGQLNKYSGQLRRVQATAEQIKSFGLWWYKNDWRGQRNQKPCPADVCREWNHFIKANGNQKNVAQAWVDVLNRTAKK